MKPTHCTMLVLLLSGCATTQQAVVVDTFCATTKKIPWSVDDDRDTIRRAEVHNKSIDRRCGVPGKKA